MYLSFPLIPFTLFAISIIASFTFYLGYRTRNKTTFDKVLLWAVCYLFINSGYVLIVELFFANEPWRDRLMPFALVYGPLMFCGLLALRDNYIRVWEVLIHLIPFIVYLVLFISISFGLIDNTLAIQGRLGKHIFILGPLSFVGYSIWAVFEGRKIFSSRFSKKKLMFIFARVLLLFLSLIFVVIFFSKNIIGNPQAVYFLRLIVYCCMLFATIMILSQVIDKIIKNQKEEEFNFETNKELKGELSRYERSALSTELLDLYEQKLILALKEEKVYLNQELSLTMLANHLRIPNHHLTQVFSVRIKQTFYQYVNGFRIADACDLLESPTQSMTLEELAEQCGFNAKVSFNRQFKLIKGCTPSEYRSKFID